MNLKNIFILFFAFLVTLGCDGEFGENRIDFEQKIKGRTINLSNKVGDLFQIIRDNDTISYSLAFDKSNNYNYLIKDKTDTIFFGTVTKRNELFLLNRPLKNGKFAIHALKFTDTTVTGLETEWVQSVIINNQIEKGNYTNFITDTTDVNTLKVERKEGKEMFRFAIDQLEPEKLITDKINETLDSLKFDSASSKQIELNSKIKKLIKKVYPNPFIDNLVIELNENSDYKLNLFDSNGKLLKTQETKTDFIIMELVNLTAGYYILKVENLTTKELDEIKVIKQ